MFNQNLIFFQAEPPEIVVATIGSLTQMLEKHVFKLEAMRVLVIDEVGVLQFVLFAHVYHPIWIALPFSFMSASSAGLEQTEATLIIYQPLMNSKGFDKWVWPL